MYLLGAAMEAQFLQTLHYYKTAGSLIVRRSKLIVQQGQLKLTFTGRTLAVISYALLLCCASTKLFHKNSDWIENGLLY